MNLKLRRGVWAEDIDLRLSEGNSCLWTGRCQREGEKSVETELTERKGTTATLVKGISKTQDATVVGKAKRWGESQRE